ncbi:MAG: cytidine deaminase [Herpetosiphonaceae bacterium]|nr:MAG: cytidine deaminase [Herpetosiphonaceae bacterium]
MSVIDFDELLRAALEARQRAYAPYSGFPVGAALLTGSGRMYPGCNIENASYPLCLCAERTALASAIAAGERDLRAMVVVAATAEPVSPCGACRQMLVEFAAGYAAAVG